MSLRYGRAAVLMGLLIGLVASSARAQSVDCTGVPAYVHVEHLADAQLKALAYLRRGGEYTTLNCGYGRGYSVRELLNMVETVAEPVNLCLTRLRHYPLAATIHRSNCIRITSVAKVASGSLLVALLAWC